MATTKLTIYNSGAPLKVYKKLADATVDKEGKPVPAKFDTKTIVEIPSGAVVLDKLTAEHILAVYPTRCTLAKVAVDATESDELKALTAQVASLKEDLSKKDEEIEALKSEKEDLNTKIAGLTNTIAERDTSIASLSEKITALEAGNK